MTWNFPAFSGLFLNQHCCWDGRFPKRKYRSQTQRVQNIISMRDGEKDSDIQLKQWLKIIPAHFTFQNKVMQGVEERRRSLERTEEVPIFIL